ncbi:MAG: sporulation protein [Hamadaea sp.]|uniref:sporulation protein n=1 Tax=Hamadaea sp. TaxID=2024425 RepID=UPI0017CF32E5|nr:sporulation protein [Hamadaea sp.]NUR74004.1 sporulation protein [Hamadaea sp.]NUT21197.1 sporulation protein [Hamadaea sp.]
MVFKKLLGSLGIGGPTVDTVLSTPTATPGGPLQGQIHLKGGGSDTEIEGITLILVAQSGGATFEVARIIAAGRFTLPAGATHAIPLNTQTPWETPITTIYGQPLPGITLGVHTQVDVRSGSGKTDLDPLTIAPLPVHNHLLDALGNLGCRFIRADLRPGQQVGLPAPVVQRVAFYAPADARQPGAHLPQLSLNFVANAHALDIAIEAGWGSPATHHTLAHTDASGDITEIIGGWVREALARLPQQAAPQGAFMQPAQPGYQQPGYRPGGPGYAGAGQGNPGYRGGGYDRGYDRGYDGGYRRGPGMGGMLAAGAGGAALGFLGGMVIGDMLTPDVDVTENVTQNYYDSGDPGADAGADSGYTDTGYDSGYADAGYDGGGYDSGGFDGGDFGGGDFGGDF